MLPFTLGKTFDKVLIINNFKKVSALDAMLSVVQAGEQQKILPLSKHIFTIRGPLYSICHNCNSNRKVHHNTAVNVIKHNCRTNLLF